MCKIQLSQDQLDKIVLHYISTGNIIVGFDWLDT